MPRALRVTILAASLVAALAGFGRSEDASPVVPPRGPAFGQNRYATRIESPDAVPDVDDYVTALRQGEALSVTVSAARHSPLRPTLVLLDPDGNDATPPLKTSRIGTFAVFRGFVIPRTGRWTVRVGGGSTEGDYTVAFSVKATRPLVIRRQHLGNDQPQFKIHTFPGLDGALLDFRLAWTDRSNAVELRAMTDTRGAEVIAADGKQAIETAATDLKRRTVTIHRLPLSKGDGDYSVRVRTPQGVSTYDVTFAVLPQGRPVNRRIVTLDANEPSLDIPPDPVRGRPGFVLRVDGRNFSVSPAPRVFFGDVEGGVVSVAPDGTHLDVTVPSGVPGTLVPVAVVNPDGQAAVRNGYFFYLQPIKVTDLVDDSGRPARVGSTRGGLTLHLRGEFFEQGQTVRFGAATGTVTSFVDATEMIVRTPAAPAGPARVTVIDRFGGVADSTFEFTFKTPPTFDTAPYTPSVAAVGTLVFVTIRGKGFEAADRLQFSGADVSSTLLGPTSRTFTVPALPAGSYSVTLTDSIGTVERGPDFTVKPPPVIASVSITGGPHVGATGVPVTGGATVQVDGNDFHETDAVTLGGATVTFLSHSPTRFTFAAPAGSLGAAALAVRDGANQTASYANALRYVGYADATGARGLRTTSADNFAADRGAVGDLDADGRADDLVIVTSYYYTGTRSGLTRLFLGDSQGKLVDRTVTDLPAAGSDTSGLDDWNASAVAIGDVDRAHGNDIVIAGAAPYSAYGGVYKSIRIFANDGFGAFALNEAAAPPATYLPSVFAVDPTGAYFIVYSALFESGSPRAMALGDLDRDGDLDLVVGRDRYELRYVGIDPTAVDFTQNPPYVATANVNYLSYFRYGTGTKVFDNDIRNGNGFVDRTGTAVPTAGTSLTTVAPCFQTRDLALGDIDRDGDLDIVETWDDPTTVSAYGTYVGSNTDSPRIATRVLRNGGTGNFTDVTSSWMPAGGVPEFWQANRLALADLDLDLDLDLVLVHSVSTDDYRPGSPSFSATALRVLRNNGTAFVNVTATAIPALPGNGDNFRGTALAVRDVDGDGFADILVGTTESFVDANGTTLRSTRLLRGSAGLVFTLDSAFLPDAATDSGEAGDILLGDLAGASDPTPILLTTLQPVRSRNGERLRVFEWNR